MKGLRGQLSGWVVLWGLIGAAPAWAEVYVVGPADYRQTLEALSPGDTLALDPGIYKKGLPLHGVRGERGARIHIAGPENGEAAVFHAQKGQNVISLKNAAWLTLRNIEVDGRGKAVDGVKAEGDSRFAHHITLQDLKIHSLESHEQINGISTKCPTWSWVIRGNVIQDAGAGMYLGDSDGSAPFVAGRIEHNLIQDPIGYGIQIKHQKARPDLEGMPRSAQTTVIRHNVFAKTRNAGEGKWARPSLLVGHFPPRGPGANDDYAIYGNFFYRNPTERLFQGEGSVALYDNLFVNPDGDAIAVQPHNGDPRRIRIFHNTVVASGTGLYFRATEATREQVVSANGVFAGRPFEGQFDRSRANVTGPYRKAGEVLKAPFAEPGGLNLAPKGDALRAEASLPAPLLMNLPDTAEDFAGRARNGEFVGAYTVSEDPIQWKPDLTIKPRPGLDAVYGLRADP